MKLSFRKVLGVAFIIAALICIYFAFLQQEKYIQGNAEYKKIKQTATDTPSDDSKHTQDFQVDWNTLKTQNPDIVGWIRMDLIISTDVFSCMQITNPIGVIQIQLYMDII